MNYSLNQIRAAVGACGLLRYAQRHFACLLIAACISGTALGDTYYGSLLCTVTESTDPAILVGDVFQSFYQYQSASIDGTFYASYLRQYATGEPSVLSGWIYEAQADFQTRPQYVLADMGIAAGAGLSYFDRITVENGVVTDFYYDNQYGAGNTWYSGHGFYFSSSTFDWRYVVVGTIDFSVPTARVPESGSTLVMIGGSIAGIAMLRRRYGRNTRISF